MLICTIVIRRWQLRWQTETPLGYPHPRHPETVSLMTLGDTSWLSAASLSEDSKAKDTWRHLMVIRTLIIRRQQVRWHAKTNVVICSLCQRPQGLSTETTLVSPLSSEMASPMTRGDTSWLSVPSSSRDSKSNDTHRPMWSSASFVGDLRVFRPRLL